MSLVALQTKDKWKGEPCFVQLKEGAKLYTETFSALEAHNTNFATPNGTTQQDGHIEKVNRSEWVPSSLAIPKKDKTVGPINDSGAEHENNANNPVLVTKGARCNVETKSVSACYIIEYQHGVVLDLV